MVRACRPRAVSVWLVTRAPARIDLEINQHDGPVVATGSRDTIQLGAFMHVAVVTAVPTEAPLQSATTYTYSLKFHDLSTGATLDFAAAVDDLAGLCYPPFNLPSFVLPADKVEDLGIVYGSCRKSHGEGRDALAGLDDMLAQGTADPRARPQQLLLLGDQIYADDVSDALAVVIDQVSRDLCGTVEQLPVKYREDDLRVGNRGRLAKKHGFTSSYARNHLFFLREYMVMYLMVWSPVLWPETLPTLAECHRIAGGKKREKFEKQRTQVALLQAGLAQVRRALANIASYMMFDDHEITDDWYLNREWTQRTAADPMARQVLTNGLIAYAFCQGWGNQPEDFEQGPQWALLEGSSKWVAADYPSEQQKPLQDLVGIPPANERLHNLDRDPAKSCRWDYRVYGPAHEIWMLDTRTWRGFPGKRGTDIPDLLGGHGWSQLGERARAESEIVLVVAPTNVIDLPHTAWASRIVAKLTSVYDSDYGDSWEAQTEAFERLLGNLAANVYQEGGQQALAILSGDVHYGFCARIHYAGRHPFAAEPAPAGARYETVMAHLTSSSFRNKNSFTELFHTRGYWPPLPWVYAWAGWHKRPKFRHTSWRGRFKAFFQSWRTRNPKAEPPLLNLENLPREVRVDPLPDWRYRIDFLGGHHPSPERLNKPYPELIQTTGRDIVGNNNFGLLRFLWPEIKQNRWIRQELWWYSENGEIAPLTQFEVPLAFGLDEPFPLPKLPQEEEET
ncbi:hypothetical protein [Acanthopleuribacter pedis]|uniref:PhoD-like phosphatase metallophosphatase domain-containing protein n=1 Tax=Acanthopleuribacter pedis TaxID=442870 RepID=A0A8J7U677_9BACT|nr:hypothetical protein [Acanthopleuribacter pedis]MBO1321629.1 hypothetical protein [Acanthopleuribacter pedis]